MAASVSTTSMQPTQLNCAFAGHSMAASLAIPARAADAGGSAPLHCTAWLPRQAMAWHDTCLSCLQALQTTWVPGHLLIPTEEPMALNHWKSKGGSKRRQGTLWEENLGQASCLVSKTLSLSRSCAKEASNTSPMPAQVIVFSRLQASGTMRSPLYTHLTAYRQQPCTAYPGCRVGPHLRASRS